jgi:hypothetical protein
MDEAGCQEMVCSKVMKDRVQSLLAARPSDNVQTPILVVAQQEELSEDAPISEFTYHKTVELQGLSHVSLPSSSVAKIGLSYYSRLTQANSRPFSSTSEIPKTSVNQGHGVHEGILQSLP